MLKIELKVGFYMKTISEQTYTMKKISIYSCRYLVHTSRLRELKPFGILVVAKDIFKEQISH